MAEGPERYRTYGRSRSVRLPAPHYRAEGTFYFVTCCCKGGQRYLEDPEIARIVLDVWRTSAERYGFRLWGLCLMPDHLHALVQKAEGDRSLGDWVRAAKTLSLKRTKGIGPLSWQAKFHDHVLRAHEDPVEETRYLVNNPVRGGLVDDWHKWPYRYLDPQVVFR